MMACVLVQQHKMPYDEMKMVKTEMVYEWKNCWFKCNVAVLNDDAGTLRQTESANVLMV